MIEIVMLLMILIMVLIIIIIMFFKHLFLTSCYTLMNLSICNEFEYKAKPYNTKETIAENVVENVC